ncbi:MAG TPA: universal stress protein [Kofleriaceae bacterium]
MTVLRSILVPLDGSAPSLAALEHALALAEDYDARIEVLEVVPSSDVVVASVRDEIERVVDAAVDRARIALGDRVSRRIVHGDPLPKIVEVASEGFDLIVMGTHGRVGRLHAMLGSVAEGVVRNAPCPVLAVRDPREGYQSFAERRHHRPSLGEQAHGLAMDVGHDHARGR